MTKPSVRPEAEACSENSAGKVLGVSAILVAALISLFNAI